MRGRNRIQAELSEYFRSEVLKPAIVAEYTHGFDEMICINQAYALMLADQKIIAGDEAARILSGLGEVREEFGLNDIDGKYEELYFNMEQMLLAKVGMEIGGKLHTGRSRNDIYATLWRMEARKSVWRALGGIIDLQEAMLRLALEYRDAVITGYTHMQPAQPITVGYYYAAAIEALGRDFSRLQDAYGRLNRSPYGAAALAGTSFPIDRAKLSDLLGFDGIVLNNLDCVGSRDYLLEIEGAVAVMMTTVSRIAQDHYIWSTNEFGVLNIGGEVAVCSSIMPQKKNPVTLELAKAKAAHMLGAFVSGCGALKNTPFSLCMDLFEVHSQYWSGLEESIQSLDLLAETLRFASFDRDLAYRRAKDNFSTVTALADFIAARCNISFSEAHDVVGDMVGAVLARGQGIDRMDARVLRVSSQRVLGRTLTAKDEEIRAVLEPASNVRAKTSDGGPGEASLAKMLERSARELGGEKAWLNEAKRRVENAYALIARQAAELTARE